MIRYNYYPTITDLSNVKQGQLRCGEHTDWGAVTFVIQDNVGGLEVKKATICKQMFLFPARFISWGRLFFKLFFIRNGGMNKNQLESTSVILQSGVTLVLLFIKKETY